MTSVDTFILVPHLRKATIDFDSQVHRCDVLVVPFFSLKKSHVLYVFLLDRNLFYPLFVMLN